MSAPTLSAADILAALSLTDDVEEECMSCGKPGSDPDASVECYVHGLVCGTCLDSGSNLCAGTSCSVEW